MSYIGDIIYEQQGDEIVFKVPITNRSGSKRCFYLDMRDESGKFLDRDPLAFIKLANGETGTIIVNSTLATFPMWNLSDVAGQRIKFELKSSGLNWIGMCKTTGYTIIETKQISVEPLIPGICTGHGIILDVDIEPVSQIIGEAEVKFHCRISNDGSCAKYFRVTLYDEYGTKIDTEPDFDTIIHSGETKVITISSVGKLWHAGTIPTTQTPYFVLEERGTSSYIWNWEALADKRYLPEWKSYTYVPPGPPIVIPDIGKVAPTMKLPGIVLEGSTFNITGTYEPNETLKLYIDRKLPELDVSIKEFTTDSNGDYDIEFEFDTAGIRKMYVSHCSLCKKSERSTIIVIGYIHIALVIAAMGMIIWKLRRAK